MCEFGNLEKNKKIGESDLQAQRQELANQNADQLNMPQQIVRQQSMTGQAVMPAAAQRQHLQAAVETNHAVQFSTKMAAVRNDKKFWGDSWRMKLVKSNIDKVTDLHNRKISKSTDFEALRAGAVDTYMELIRVCNEYLTARGVENEDSDTRHGRVRELLEAAKQGLLQVSSMKQADFSALFGEGDEKVLLGQVLKKDALNRGLDTEEVKNEAVPSHSLIIKMKTKHMSLKGLRTIKPCLRI